MKGVRFQSFGTRDTMTLVLNLTLIVQNVSLISYVDKKFHLSLKFFGVSEFGFRNV